MMKTKQLLTILIILFSSIPAISQGQLKDVFKMQYDQNGDRINKYYCCTVLLKTADTTQTELLQQRIAYTDKQIDRLVYKLYDLTEEEIRVVEGG